MESSGIIRMPGMTDTEEARAKWRRIGLASIAETRLGLEATEDVPEGRRLTALWGLLQLGDARRARDLILAHPQGMKRDRLLAIAERLTEGGRGPDEDVAVAPATGEAREILVAFAGSGFRFVMQPHLFAREDQHVVLVRDLRACFCMAGIDGLGEDYGSSTEGLRSVLDRLGAGQGRLPVHAVGTSTGGYAALRYGLDVEADRVTVFGSPGSIRLADDETASMKRYPELVPVGECAPEQVRSAIELYRERNAAEARGAPYGGIPRVLAVHGELHERDTLWAGLIAGIPGARTLSLEGVDTHHVFNLLGANGRLRDLVAPLPGHERIRPDASDGERRTALDRFAAISERHDF